jgi:hypothetical protein
VLHGLLRLRALRALAARVLTRAALRRYRSIVQPGALLAAHEYTVSRFLHMQARSTRKEESGSGTSRPGLHVQMRVRRAPLFWALNVWLPLFCFTGVSFASFAVEVTALSNRLSITITLWLVLAAYRFTIMDNLPKTNCVTYLDMYCQVCFLVCFAVSVHAVSLAVRAEVSLPQLALDGAAAVAPSWAEPIAWQASQRGALLGCSIAWLSINLILPLVIFLQRHVLPSGRETIRWWDTADNVLWFRGISNVHGEVSAADRVALRDHIVACMPAESAKLKSRVHFKSIMPYCELKGLLPATSARSSSVGSGDSGTSGLFATVRNTVNGWLGASADVRHTRGNSLKHQDMTQDTAERRALLRHLEKSAALIASLLPAPRNFGYALLELEDANTAAAVCAVLEAAAKVTHPEPGVHLLPLQALNAWIRDNWQQGSDECSTPRTCAKRSLDEAGERKPDYVVEIAVPEYKCMLKRPWWDLAPEPAEEASVSAAPTEKPADKPAAPEADGKPAAAVPEGAAHVAVSVPRQAAVVHETAAAAAEEQAEAEEAAAAAHAVHPAEADEARCAAAAADVGSARRDSHAETASPAEESV